jgi:hypothetical protein
MVLEFSNPSIQGFSDFTNLKDEDSIMYYYYTVKIFKKVTDWDDKDEDKEIVKWKLISKRNVYDFPCIEQLKWILDYQLKDDTRIDGQKHEYQSGDIRYSKVVETQGFACEDFYEITKSVDSEGKDDRYIVYCGTSFSGNGDLNSTGIRTPYVTRKDISELLKCVSGFIQYSIDDHNEGVAKQKDKYKIKGNKIYEYEDDKLESIFAIEDNLDIKTVIDNKENDNDNVVVSNIQDDYIYLNNETKIDINSVVYINNNVTNEKLKYNENEIAEEFISILSNEEREEFINSDTDLLLDKYKSAIIDRSAMCRDEHEFNIDYDSGNRVENVAPIVRNVINIIKSNLNK